MAVLVHSRVKSVNLRKCHFPKRGAKPQTCPVCGAVGSQLPMTLWGSGNTMPISRTMQSINPTPLPGEGLQKG